MLFILLIAGFSARLIIDKSELKTRKDEVILDKSVCNIFNKTLMTGYLEVKSGFISFMYYHNTTHQSNSVYIGGGPGQSSQVINFVEIGQSKNNTWFNFTNLLFLDLPAGTGFGITNATNLTLDDVVVDYEIAIKAFQKECNVVLEKIFIFSSDYGARFAIHIASKVSNIVGIGLLDPFLDTISIVSEIPNYAYHLGLIDYQERQVLEKQLIGLISLMNKEGTQGNILKLKFINSFVQYIYSQSGKMSVYNILNMKNYYEEEAAILTNKELYNLEQYKFQTEFIVNSKIVNEFFNDEFITPYNMTVLSDLLNRKDVSVLIYQSQFDLLIPPSATMRWLNELDYELQQYFYQVEMKNFTLNNSIKGLVKKGGKLEYYIIKESGQLMHRDKSKECYDLIEQFIRNQQ